MPINNVNNQFDKYNEAKSFKDFKKKYEKSSIIKKIFFIPKEIIQYCPVSNMACYNFVFRKFILIELDKEIKDIKLNEKIFLSEEKTEKVVCHCSLCGGRKTDSIMKKKVLNCPEVLIVILEGKNYSIFNMKNNINILNINNTILYNLKCFIEAHKNDVYFESYGDWFKYANNNVEIGNNYDMRNPAVLIYKLNNNNNKNLKEDNVNNNNFNKNKNNNNANDKNLDKINNYLKQNPMNNNIC